MLSEEHSCSCTMIILFHMQPSTQLREMPRRRHQRCVFFNHWQVIRAMMTCRRHTEQPGSTLHASHSLKSPSHLVSYACVQWFYTWILDSLRNDIRSGKVRVVNGRSDRAWDSHTGDLPNSRKRHALRKITGVLRHGIYGDVESSVESHD